MNPGPLLYLDQPLGIDSSDCQVDAARNDLKRRREKHVQRADAIEKEFFPESEIKDSSTMSRLLSRDGTGPFSYLASSRYDLSGEPCLHEDLAQVSRELDIVMSETINPYSEVAPPLSPPPWQNWFQPIIQDTRILKDNDKIGFGKALRDGPELQAVRQFQKIQEVQEATKIQEIQEKQNGSQTPDSHFSQANTVQTDVAFIPSLMQIYQQNKTRVTVIASTIGFFLSDMPLGADACLFGLNLSLASGLVVSSGMENGDIGELLLHGALWSSCMGLAVSLMAAFGFHFFCFSVIVATGFTIGNLHSGGYLSRECGVDNSWQGRALVWAKEVRIELQKWISPEVKCDIPNACDATLDRWNSPIVARRHNLHSKTSFSHDNNAEVDSPTKLLDSSLHEPELSQSVPAMFRPKHRSQKGNTIKVDEKSKIRDRSTRSGVQLLVGSSVCEADDNRELCGAQSETTEVYDRDTKQKAERDKVISYPFLSENVNNASRKIVLLILDC